MDNKNWIKFTDKHRFEFLLLALCLLLFDKAFFPDNVIYLRVVWPLNMLILSLASIGLFRDNIRSRKFTVFKNIAGILSFVIPFFFEFYADNRHFMIFLIVFYIGYYSLLFYQTMLQIIRKNETNISVLFGSISGYLLLILIAIFTFMMVEYMIPQSFKGISYTDLAVAYNDLTYYSFTLVTSTGFGDIVPINDSSRLASSLFAVVAQFYMVALVGIVVSRFDSLKK